jgi:hypothetical protein
MPRKLGLYLAVGAMALVMTPAGVAVASTGGGTVHPGIARGATAACTHWSHKASPNPGSEGRDELNGVTATSRSNAWVVGDYSAGSTAKTLVEHWNGEHWKKVSSPNRDGSGTLIGVYARSADNVWASGFSYNSGGIKRSLIEHWNGHRWKVVPSPNAGSPDNDNAVISIRGTSADNVWAVGGVDVSTAMDKAVIWHWNGHHWRIVTAPNVSGTSRFLTSVRPLSRTSAWAVGFTNHGQYRTLILHWNGKHWRRAASPNSGSGYNLLSGVLATSSTSAWAVGEAQHGTHPRSLMLHWNGKHWRKVAVPGPGSGSTSLVAIGGTSSKNVYAVGTAGPSPTQNSLVLHWNGKHWRTMAARNPGTDINFNSVFVLNASSVWVAGSYAQGGSTRTLIEHCS